MTPIEPPDYELLIAEQLAQGYEPGNIINGLHRDYNMPREQAFELVYLVNGQLVPGEFREQ